MALALLTDGALADRISLRVWAVIDSSDGIFVAPFEQGEIGSDLFRAACNMGLEGLVSKRRDCPYVWQVEALVEGDEPEAAGDEPGDGLALICRA